MFNGKIQLSKLFGLLLVFCLALFAVHAASSQPLPSVKSPSKTLDRVATKTQLAAEVLSEIGIATRYDLHFGHLTGMLISKENDAKLDRRFQQMFAREMGWKYFKDAYAARLAADLSADELTQLRILAKQPVMKKLLQSEFKAYTDTSARRLKMGFKLWDNYNSGNIDLPPN
jgi:hypothetical protein